MTLLADLPTLKTGDANATKGSGVTITATVKDSSNNVLKGQSVSFSSSKGLLVGGSPVSTDANGSASIKLFTGGDQKQQTITVTATAGSVTQTINVDASGNVMKLVSPGSAQQGVAASFTLSFVDTASTGIAQDVLVTSNETGSSVTQTLTTNASGQLSFSLTPTGSGTSFTVSVKGKNTGFDTSAVSATVPVSIDQFSFQSTNTSTAGCPKTLSTTGTTEYPLNVSCPIQLGWKRNGANVPDGTPVTFKLSRGSPTSVKVFTSAGVATTNITSAESGGVTIAATGDASALTPAGSASPNATQSTSEFVATTPALISVQANPTVIAPSAQSQVVAVVRDANSNPVKNSVVDFVVSGVGAGVVSPTSATTDSNGTVNAVYTASGSTTAQDGVSLRAQVDTSPGINSTVKLTQAAGALRVSLGTGNKIIAGPDTNTQYSFPYTVTVLDAAGAPAKGATVNLTLAVSRFVKGADSTHLFGPCNTDDLNHNGILDSGDNDLNGNGKIDPDSDAAVSASTVTIGDSGSVSFNVIYTKDEASFTEVILTAKAVVSGSEGASTRTFFLPHLKDDEPDVPIYPSKYGKGQCTDNF